MIHIVTIIYSSASVSLFVCYVNGVSASVDICACIQFELETKLAMPQHSKIHPSGWYARMK
jgi:hypothetical protein